MLRDERATNVLQPCAIVFVRGFECRAGENTMRMWTLLADATDGSAAGGVVLAGWGPDHANSDRPPVEHLVEARGSSFPSSHSASAAKATT